MKYLFDAWKDVVSTIKSAGRFVLLLDYDGTLTPIVERPELAVLSESMRTTLQNLARKYPVGIISGRSLKDVKALVALEDIFYVGNHGFEIAGPDLELIHPEAKKSQPVIKEICEKLEKDRISLRISEGVEGVLVENKGLSASWHYRLVPEEKIAAAKESFNKTLAPYLEKNSVKVTEGKKVFEIRPPVDWDKGKAVLWILEKVFKDKDVVPAYVGDDRTDDDAFVALRKRDKCITIFVAGEKKESEAEYFVKDVDEVERFFSRLLEI